MTDTVPEPVAVPASPLEAQIKGQVRLVLAALAGALVLRNLLPAWLVNDQTLDMAAGAVMLALASGWSWVRARFNHARLFTVASDPRVPDAVAFVATPGRTG